MNKKTKIASVFAIFLISAITHGIYEWFPNNLTALFFPVNESIWEHNKIIISAFFIWSIFEKIKYKEKSSFLYNILSSIICCFLVMIIFSPIYFYILNTKDNMIVALSIYFISICISQFIHYKYFNKNVYKDELLGIVIFIIILLINAFFTFNPLHNKLFYDFNNNHYGIKK